MKILFSGGGTLGPVTPLLAVAEELRSRDASHEFFWIGTERGAELPLIRKAGIQTFTIPSGKLRRYFDFKNFTDIKNIVRGFFAARSLLKELQPDVVMSAGGFVSVPVHYAAWSLGIPSVVHQQDIVIGLSNKLMSWVAKRVSVSVEEQLQKIAPKKAVLTGNPVRASVLAGDPDKGIELFRLDPERATVFVFGGGTGSDAINRAVEQLVRECAAQFQIIHLTGSERSQPQVHASYYHPYPFLMGEMAHAYATADLVIARAGFNTISEIAAWGKPSILIPMHGTHQEANAEWAANAGAAVVIDEYSLSTENLFQKIRELLTDESEYQRMSEAAENLFPSHAVDKVVDVLEESHNKK